MARAAAKTSFTSGPYKGRILLPEKEGVIKPGAKGARSGIGKRTIGPFGHSFHIFVNNGGLLRCRNGEINTATDVTASIGELAADNTPFLGNAVMQVFDIAPFNGGVLLRVSIGWPNALRYQIMLTYGI